MSADSDIKPGDIIRSIESNNFMWPASSDSAEDVEKWVQAAAIAGVNDPDCDFHAWAKKEATAAADAWVRDRDGKREVTFQPVMQPLQPLVVNKEAPEPSLQRKTPVLAAALPLWNNILWASYHQYEEGTEEEKELIVAYNQLTQRIANAMLRLENALIAGERNEP